MQPNTGRGREKPRPVFIGTLISHQGTISLRQSRRYLPCTDFAAHVTVLGAGKYGVENLAKLGTIPPKGVTIVVGAPKHAGASGGPTYVFAIYPGRDQVQRASTGARGDSMGYCPRCGENSAFGATEPGKRDLRPRALRIPAGSRIVDLPSDLQDGEVIQYGGSRFRVRRDGNDYLMEIAE